MLKAKAQCLCGAVTIMANQINPKFTVCHCDSCRGWSGAPFFAVQCGTDVIIEGQDHIKEYDSWHGLHGVFVQNAVRIYFIS